MFELKFRILAVVERGFFAEKMEKGIRGSGFHLWIARNIRNKARKTNREITLNVNDVDKLSGMEF